MAASRNLDEALLTLAWSLWTELGVAGVVRQHRDCAVDPEALILFTAPLATLDPRLRDESLDCALQIARYLSMGRLKNLLRELDEPTAAAFAPYAATFNAHSKSHARFPTTDQASPWPFRRSGKSRFERFTAPGQVMLRLRALFGVSAAADALTAMLCAPPRGWLATEIAERAGHGKRVIASALQDFERGGMLKSTRVGNRLRFDLLHRDEAEVVAGELPARNPPWLYLLPFLGRARRLLHEGAGRPSVALLVDAQKMISAHLEILARLGVPEALPDFDSWETVAAWLTAKAEGVASGRSGWLSGGPSTTGGRRKTRKGAS